MDLQSSTSRFADDPAFSDSAIGVTDAALPAAHSASRLVAVRLRRGAKLPNGRPVGESGRVVHLARVPVGTAAPECLTTLCELTIEPGQADQVAIAAGMPCEPCLIATPRSSATGATGSDRRA